MSNETLLAAFFLRALLFLPAVIPAVEVTRQVLAKEEALEYARGLAQGKGIINLGAGPHRTFQAQVIAETPEVMANIDIVPNGMPHFLQFDIERQPLPFNDKHFGCAFASHVLEHLNNWQFALDEMVRVADFVVVVLPHPAFFSGYITPEHRQHFTTDDIQEISSAYPSVAIFY